MRFVDTWLDGRRCDLRVDSGRIDVLRWLDSEPGLDPVPGEQVRTGGCITPPLAEPHCHLDAALLGADAPLLAGQLDVVVANIAEDPLWRDLRDAASIAGVASCWSYPITTTSAEVLGAMALYRKVGFLEEGRQRRHSYTNGRFYDWIWLGLLLEEFDENEGRTSGLNGES